MRTNVTAIPAGTGVRAIRYTATGPRGSGPYRRARFVGNSSDVFEAAAAYLRRKPRSKVFRVTHRKSGSLSVIIQTGKARF